MKNRCIILLMLAGLLVGASPALANDSPVMERLKQRKARALSVPDALQNGGFEAGDSMPGWSAVVHAGDSYLVKPDDLEPFSGKGCLMIRNTGKPSWGGAIQRIRVDQKAGRTVVLTAQARGSGVSGKGFHVGLKVEKMGGDWQFVKMEEPLQGDADWKRIDLSTQLPQESAHLEVHLILEGDGTVWVDDVQLDFTQEEEKQ